MNTTKERGRRFGSFQSCGRSLAAASLLVALAALPGFTQTAATQSASNPATETQNILIGPGDTLDVQVFNTPELSARLRVDQRGQITLPLGGMVTVQGLNVAAAASRISQTLLSTQIMLAPSVTVSTVEYATQGVTVLGEVHSPGIYTLLGTHSLYDALASAGGANTSEGSKITISHAGDADHPLVVEVNGPDYSAVQKATMVQPGDTVVVSRAAMVYVVGDVVRSGAFYIESGQRLTVLNLVSLAQGINRTAALGHASIVRPTPEGGATTLPFNLNKVMKNQEPNLVVKAGDVLVIPRSGWKDFGFLALPGFTNAVSSATTAALITR